MSRPATMARTRATDSMLLFRKLWPPKPGFTVITSTRSTQSSTGSTIAAGVPGLIATPARLPRSRMVWSERWICGPASAWTVMPSAPACAKAARYGSAGAIIRCTSKNFSVCGRSAFTTGGPKVMLGTKCPSITSRWIQSAPAASTARVSSASFEKSAARIEGAMTGGSITGLSETVGMGSAVCVSLNEAPPTVTPAAAGARRAA